MPLNHAALCPPVITRSRTCLLLRYFQDLEAPSASVFSCYLTNLKGGSVSCGTLAHDRV
jgi:hypothetical protein